MRILLISDIHANLVALETVLERAGKVDAVWCLGDVVGYGPAPNECIELLRTLPLTCLAGNHDWAVLGKLDTQDFNDAARHAVQWTQHELKPENLEWLGQLPEAKVLPTFDLTLVHASPRAPVWEYILSPVIAAENMPYFQTSACLFGHTHIPIIYRQSRGDARILTEHLQEGQPLVLSPCMLVNPGSVGQPRDRDPRAAFGLLDPDQRALTYYRVPYDIAKTQAQMEKAKLPPRLIARLDYGV